MALHSEKLNRQAFEKLARAMRAPIRPLALVGAGVSVRAGFPTWGTLLDRLHESAMEHRPMPPKVAQNLRLQPDMLWRAEEYREHLGEGAYFELLREWFRDVDGSAPLDPVLLDLVRLPFAHVLTTNYDNVLELAHQRAGLPQPAQVVEWTDARALRDFLVNLAAPARRYVYLHGRATRPETVVLTDRDYVERYARSVDAHRKLFALFTTQRLVFVGFSLSDPELSALLREVHVALGPGEPRHFALLALREEEEDTLERRRLRQKYGIDPIFYPFSPNHAALGPLLAALKAGRTDYGDVWGPAREAPPPPMPAPQATPPPDKGNFLSLPALQPLEEELASGDVPEPPRIPSAMDPSEPEVEKAGSPLAPRRPAGAEPAAPAALPLSFSAHPGPQAVPKHGPPPPAPAVKPAASAPSTHAPAPGGFPAESPKTEYLGSFEAKDDGAFENGGFGLPSALVTRSNPEDPQKGRWGGLPERNGHRLSAKVHPASDGFTIELTVRATGSRRRRGSVIFHLHPALAPATREVALIDGVATLSVTSLGAFTAGAEVKLDEGTRTPLELDLAEVADAPTEFREG